MGADSVQDQITVVGDAPAAVEPTASSSSAPPSIPPGSDSNLERASLENEKLRVEVRKLKEEEGRKWWRTAIRDVKVSEWVVAIAMLVGLSAAFWTGLFSSTKESLSAQKESLSAQADRLTVEKIYLEQKKETLVAEVAAKEKELVDVRARLLPYEEEEAAIGELRRLDNNAKFRVQFKGNHVIGGLTVSISGGPFGPDGWSATSDTEPKWLYRPASAPALAKALKSVGRLQSIKELRVRYLVLSTADLRLASRAEGLKTLVINNADLDSKGLAGLETKSDLRQLNVSNNRLKSFSECPRMESVHELIASKNPLGDDGLDALVAAFPNLRYLDIEGTDVSDEGLKVLSALPELTAICLRNTRVTGKGLAGLLECPRLRGITFNPDRITDQVRASFQTKTRLVFLNDGRDSGVCDPVPPLRQLWVPEDPWDHIEHAPAY